MEYFIVILVCYILGSLSPALITGKTVGKLDIREVNSKNAGTSNVAMTLGLKWGIVVGVSDILKGFIPVIIIRLLFPENDILWVLGGLSAIVGHVYPFYLKFRGGKGTATFGGVLLALTPIVALVLLVLFFAILFLTDYIALSTLFVIIIAPFTLYFSDYHTISIGLIALYSCLSFYKHYPNFKRILRKQEVGLRAAFKK